jgi:hypothetical protein
VQGKLNIFSAYKPELIALSQVPWNQKQNRRFSSAPISLTFGFLLACLSRLALDLARTFLPLPSYRTISEHFREKIDSVESGLNDISYIGRQIERFIAANDISPNSLISLH